MIGALLRDIDVLTRGDEATFLSYQGPLRESRNRTRYHTNPPISCYDELKQWRTLRKDTRALAAEAAPDAAAAPARCPRHSGSHSNSLKQKSNARVASVDASIISTVAPEHVLIGPARA